MITVTYLENDVRSTRKCDFLEYRYIKSVNANVPVLLYRDVENDFGEEQFRINILAPGTIIEKIA